MRLKKPVVLLVVLLGATAACVAWRLARAERPAGELVLYGNVDFRQADLAFRERERIVELMFEEGDRVEKGEVLARIDTARLLAQVSEAESAALAQRAAVLRLKNGTRPEEVAQARAGVQSAEAEVLNARRQRERMVAISAQLEGRAVSRQDVETSEAELAIQEAHLEVERRALDLALAGPRAEDIEEAEAMARAAEARLAELKATLADAELVAPAAALVRARLMEVGELSAPERPVYSLAVTDPKWVRAYVSGADLGRVRPGASASVRTDGSSEAYEGSVGFVSPVAEFTPKSVETEELRTSLVYEVRIHVRDPRDELRLGMPATVTLGLEPGGGGG